MTKVFRSFAEGIVFARCQVDTSEEWKTYVEHDLAMTRDVALASWCEGNASPLTSQAKFLFVVRDGWQRGEDDFSPGDHVLAHVDFSAGRGLETFERQAKFLADAAGSFRAHAVIHVVSASGRGPLRGQTLVLHHSCWVGIERAAQADDLNLAMETMSLGFPSPKVCDTWMSLDDRVGLARLLEGASSGGQA